MESKSSSDARSVTVFGNDRHGAGGYRDPSGALRFRMTCGTEPASRETAGHTSHHYDVEIASGRVAQIGQTPDGAALIAARLELVSQAPGLYDRMAPPGEGSGSGGGGKPGQRIMLVFGSNIRGAGMRVASNGRAFWYMTCGSNPTIPDDICSPDYHISIWADDIGFGPQILGNCDDGSLTYEMSGAGTISAEPVQWIVLPPISPGEILRNASG